jgi:hypothetical protein
VKQNEVGGEIREFQAGFVKEPKEKRPHGRGSVYDRSLLKWVLGRGWKFLTGCSLHNIASKLGFFKYTKETFGSQRRRVIYKHLKAVISEEGL